MEEIARSDPHYAPAFGLQKLTTLDVDMPLPRVHPMPVAFVLECDSSPWKAEVRVQHDRAALDRDRGVDLEPSIAEFVEQETEQALRPRVAADADARQRPITALCAFRARQCYRGLGQFEVAGEGLTIPRADEMIARCNEVVPTDNARQLAPHLCRRADGKPIDDLPRDASKAVSDHSAPSGSVTWVRDRDVKRLAVQGHRHWNAEKRSRGLVAEERSLREQVTIDRAEFADALRRHRHMDRMEGVVEIALSQPRCIDAVGASVVGTERDAHQRTG